ncbi:hypothetical protein WOLCODRAFT_137435 [Wolfiporia cocos MD-104 SS10]|uniref:Uncharacterized protein n=1 Tax=Wolfiporia cocos (strain MD-104) TaxID=742152 RepID=A0A2H3JZD5_WOLCO|nr:hypothetical protein WOLCODRAFT_137435 [Wolfiporia cocos MD-104 SS10]
MTSINDATGSSFEEHLQATTMPPPGPDHFNARRAVWCKARPDRTQPTDTTGQRERLEAVLNQEGAVESDDVWEVQGVKQAWSRIMDGRRLRQRLPLRVVVRALTRDA